MKRYRFPLASVLRIRKVEEDHAIADLARTERRRMAAEEYALRRAEAHRELAPGGGVATAQSFLAARARHERSADALLAADEEVGAARTAVLMSRMALNAAAAAVAALENLDERRREEHALENLREEAAEVDDLVTGRHRRGHR